MTSGWANAPLVLSLAFCLVACATDGSDIDAAVDAGTSPDGDPNSIADADPNDFFDAFQDPSCNAPIPCPVPTGDTATICGRVFDSETTLAVLPAAAAYRVAAYDLLAFAADSTMPPQLTGLPDSCGRFALAGVDVPSTSKLVIAVDDAEDAGTHFVTTGIILEGAAATVVEDVRAFATRRTTDQAWSSSAGLAGASFSQRGVYLPIFIDTTQAAVAPFPGTPRAGVVVLSDGDAVPVNDFYFSNTAVRLRSTVSGALAATGANGSALFVNGPLVPYSGQGGTPPGCSWPSSFAGSFDGVVLVQEQLLTCP